MTTTLRVRAAHPDRPVFQPGMRRTIADDGREMSAIYADQVVEVPNERFYRRRIAVGDLVLVTEVAEVAAVSVVTEGAVTEEEVSQ